MKRIVIILAVVALMGTAIGAVFASAAAITVAPGNVGSGTSAALAGYTVTAVVWTLETGDPTHIESVAFTISPAPSTVFADTNAGGLQPCGVSGTSANCDLDPNPLASAVTSLIVSAAN